MVEEDITIKIPYEIAKKLSKKIGETGFKSITEYVTYLLEQAVSSEEQEEERDEEEEKNVRKRLKELGYL